jgi:hypothetical protein
MFLSDFHACLMLSSLIFHFICSIFLGVASLTSAIFSPSLQQAAGMEDSQ